MNNPFDYSPDPACREAFSKLDLALSVLHKSNDPGDVSFLKELEEGKMLGVLIAADRQGEQKTLFAFSGQIGDAGFHRKGFVGPVFDYLHPEGHFKSGEAAISRLNDEIARFQEGKLTALERDYSEAKSRADAQIAEFKEVCRLSKAERDARRQSGLAVGEAAEALIRRSQFEKAELRRLKKRLSLELEPFANLLQEARGRLESMKKKRRSDSEALQDWLFTNFKILNARGESRTLTEIFARTTQGIPPSGAGECCAPKLLQAAFLQGLKPLAIAERWYGRAKAGEIRIAGEYYPACRGKCLPILQWMLQGLCIEPPLDSSRRLTVAEEPEIIYENRWFCVVNKPAGMLSVPGKGAAISLQQWLADKYGPERLVRMAHRLDQDTSGLIIATFGQLPLKTMQALFATRNVKKLYVAELEGDYESKGISRQGRIELPLSPDWLDRPRQRVDFEDGKTAVTDYEFIGVTEGHSRVMFYPLTGRTHQLRVHAASESGLGMPIAGDPLYGKNHCNGTERLLLHALKIEFTFPLDGQHYTFEAPVPF